MTMALLQVVVAAATLQGKIVVWGSTTPIAQVEVELQRLDNSGALPIVAVTNPQGEFRFPSVPPGGYRLIAMRPGFTQAEYRQRRPGGTGSAITLSARQNMTGVTLGMAPGGAIAGRMMDRDGQPLVRANVQAVRLSYVDGKPTLTTIQSALTNDLGEYRLFWLPPGRYYVSFRPPGPGFGVGSLVVNPNAPDSSLGVARIMRSRPQVRNPRPPNLDERETYLPVYFPGTTELPSAALINLRAGEVIRDVSVNSVIRKTTTLRVTPLDGATGQDMSSSAAVFLTPLVAPLPRMIAQYINNVATFRAVPGFYEVRASTSSTKTGRVIVEVADRDLEVTVVMAAFVVSGSVRIENAPARFDLRKQQVVLRAEPGFRATGSIEPDGMFRVEDVPAGGYQVAVSDGALQDVYVSSIRMGQDEFLGRNLLLTSQPQDPLEITLSGNGAELAGAVINDRQQGLSEATVVLIPNLPSSAARLDLYKTATTDSSGHFQIRGIAPGEYSVYAWEDVDPGAWLDPNFIAIFRDLGTTIRVANGERLTVQILAIP